ncbi:coniferyl aldehyde dehydrogenase [Hahella sp. SMD15-11]|uniref:Aldehyde dehydrogenase n=1 Tax=Thermohahella caldifontis TaxID=3142973 RepID=A0AB39UVX4_9GAMM
MSASPKVVRFTQPETPAESHPVSAALQETLTLQRNAFNQNPAPTFVQRKEMLNRLKQALLDNQERILDALDLDFGGRSRDESRLAELMPSVQGIHYTLRHLKEWMKPSQRKVDLLFMPADNKVYYQPLGVVGIIVPWNYPLYLAVGPLTAALAAGNRVMIKMSEYTPATSALFKEIIEANFSLDQIAVFTGEADVAAAFSRLPFDHLLFTGSTRVGKQVMKAAAENLTPVTLELGGKSPAIVSHDVPMKDAAQRVAFGKSFNAGQTCVAPDYVLVPEHRVDEFIQAFREEFARMYPSVRNNPDFTSIINTRQRERLLAHVEDARAKGAEIIVINPANESFDEGTNKLPVHLIRNVTDDMTVMQEEIFGPLLPIIPYTDIIDAIAFINARPRPLALYYFGYDKAEQRRILDRTHSGGVCINDTLMHVAQDDMPFGGIGESGMGHYHGYEGFLTFSNHRGVHAKQRLHSGQLVYPPYGTALHKAIYRFFIR